MILKWHDTEIECEKAVNNENEIFLYDINNNLIQHIFNISEQEWKYISLQNGEWTDQSDIPTVEEQLKSDIDYLTMENESLRADVDYLLMMIENS